MVPSKPVASTDPVEDDIVLLGEQAPPRPHSALTQLNVGDDNALLGEPEPVISPTGSEEPLGRFAQDELAQIRAARAALDDEKRSAEHALDQRRLELERQSQLLVGRLHELHEREERLAEELEDALPERMTEYPRRSSCRPDESEAAPTFESEGLRRQLREQKMSLELLSAERDAAWSQLSQYRDCQHELEHLRAERDALHRTGEPGAETAPSDDAQALHRELEELQKLHVQMRQERDEAWSYLQELPERVSQLETVKAERDGALEQLRSLTQNFLNGDVPSPDSEWVDLDSPQGEQELLKIQLSEQREQLQKLGAERDEAWRCLQEAQNLPARQQEEIDQLSSERDSAITQLRNLSAEPEHWAQEEAEFAALRLQLKQDQRQLAEDMQELHRRESDMARRAEQARREVHQEQQRLEDLSRELKELAQQLREDRSQLEVKERDMRLRDAQIHLREAEIREMVEIAELDAARERTELNQERLKLARLREAIRLDRAALRIDQEKHGIPPTSLGANI